MNSRSAVLMSFLGLACARKSPEYHRRLAGTYRHICLLTGTRTSCWSDSDSSVIPVGWASPARDVAGSETDFCVQDARSNVTCKPAAEMFSSVAATPWRSATWIQGTRLRVCAGGMEVSCRGIDPCAETLAGRHLFAVDIGGSSEVSAGVVGADFACGRSGNSIDCFGRSPSAARTLGSLPGGCSRFSLQIFGDLLSSTEGGFCYRDPVGALRCQGDGPWRSILSQSASREYRFSSHHSVRRIASNEFFTCTLSVQGSVRCLAALSLAHGVSSVCDREVVREGALDIAMSNFELCVMTPSGIRCLPNAALFLRCRDMQSTWRSVRES